MKSKFSYYKQAETKDCGLTCIKIIAKDYGKIINAKQLRTLSETTREGSSLLGLSETVENIGFQSLGVKLSFNKLLETFLPYIVHWNKNHYVVVYKIKKEIIYISETAHGLTTYTKGELIKHWIGNNANKNTEDGIALLVNSIPKFYQEKFEKEEPRYLKFNNQIIEIRYKN